MATEQRET